LTLRRPVAVRTGVTVSGNGKPVAAAPFLAFRA